MYNLLGIHYSRWTRLFFFLAFLIRIRIYPRSVTKGSLDKYIKDKAVIYVLPKMSIMDILVLNKALRKLEQKKVEMEALPNKFQHASIMALKPRSILFLPNTNNKYFSEQFKNIIDNDNRISEDKIVFIPVSVFWSRAPERNEKGFLLRSLFPDDGTGNGLQKLFMLILHRGEVNISFGKIFDPKRLDTNAQRMQRLFNIEFAKERAAAFGPTLYEDDKISQWILSTPETRKMIVSSENPKKTEIQIVRYIREIASNYNYVTIRALEKLFDFIWNRVFDGVRVQHFEYVERMAKEGQVVWMPSHRSHFDYLLLSYVLFKRGFVIPHIAAGINLNFWPIGSIVRRGGAFYIRRSFAGNKIYAHTFAEYVNFLMQNSFPIEFFQEGGRSRIGKLLSPKIGMLSICVQSVLQRKAANTFFIPVYFGYNKVMEENSYAKELKGAKKQKENAWQFLNGIRKVFTNYGSATVSFGDPVRIGDVWEEYVERIKKENINKPFLNAGLLPERLIDVDEHYDVRDPKIQGFIKFLAGRINQKINAAAVASNTAILSTILLVQTEKYLPTHAFQYDIILLHYLINRLGKLLNWKISTNQNPEYAFEYLKSRSRSEFVLDEKKDFKDIHAVCEQIFAQGEKWKFLNKATNSQGWVCYSSILEREFNLWWYRGTIFHILAGFGILAVFLLNSKPEDRILSRAEAKMSFVRRIWQDELFWDISTSSSTMTRACLDIFIELELVTLIDSNKIIIHTEDQRKKEQLESLAQIIQPEIELYKIQITSALELIRNKGFFTRDDLGQKAFADHTIAFSKALVSLPPIFSKVLSQRIFDAFYKAGVFIPGENQKLFLNAAALSGVSDFFGIKL